jgi:predicted nicotinamide N-methyase
MPSRQTKSSPDARKFIRANTALSSPHLVPEIKLHLGEDIDEFWVKSKTEVGAISPWLPYWAFAWNGGKAVARYVLDHPELVEGKHVLDIASGSGIVAIAAAKAGAASVTGNDLDQLAVAAIAMNAAANQVKVTVVPRDVMGRAEPPPRKSYDVVLAGDVFYVQAIARKARPFLERQAKAGALVLIGDPGNTYIEYQRLVRRAEYKFPQNGDLYQYRVRKTVVWELKAKQPRA